MASNPIAQEHGAQVDKALDYIDANLVEALERLKAVLRIPSISTDPEFAADCEEAANYFVNELQGLGFEAQAYQTNGHPMVVARYDGAPAGAQRVLFYGHYDVQPPDPLELWETPPFEPQVLTREDGTKFIRARGVSDDKAQVRTFIEACRAWIATQGRLPVNVTVFLEGEEESGSPSMKPFMEEHAGLLTADIAMICDTHMWNRDTPAITISLRGTAAGEVTIKAADIDLHSGLFGGPARNPLEVLSRILADLRDDDGAVQLPGFYDGVPEVDPALKQVWDKVPFDAKAFLGNVGLSLPAGESERSVLEQVWARPTAEINGMWGGYTGKGFKTVIPAEASAKVSFRLFGEQDPEQVWSSFEQFVRERLPADCEASFVPRSGSPACVVAYDNPYLQATRAALDEEWTEESLLLGGGGSIPMPLVFKKYLGLESIMPGFGLEDDAIHSPNEKYEMQSFHKGQRSWVRILDKIAQLPAT